MDNPGSLIKAQLHIVNKPHGRGLKLCREIAAGIFGDGSAQAFNCLLGGEPALRSLIDERRNPLAFGRAEGRQYCPLDPVPESGI